MFDLVKASVYDSTLDFKKTGNTPERMTDVYEIELYISGEGESYIDGVAYPHEKGKLIFVKPNQKRHSRNRFTCCCVHMSMDDATAQLVKNVPPAMKVINFSEYKMCYMDIIRLYESMPQKHELLLQGKVYKLLDMIVNEKDMKAKKLTTKISADTIEKSIAFIKANFHQQLTLDDIAENVSYSPVYFHRAFKEYTGKTPHEFLKETRLEAVKMQLLVTDYAMDKIAEMCGFLSLSYFDYIFKTTYGITPSEFRKRKYLL